MVLVQRRWMCLFCWRGEQRLNWITADLTLLLSVCAVVSRCTWPHRVTPADANCRLKNCCCSSCCCQVDGGAAAGRPYTYGQATSTSPAASAVCSAKKLSFLFARRFLIGWQSSSSNSMLSPAWTDSKWLFCFVLFFLQTPPRVLHSDKQKGVWGSRQSEGEPKV